MELKNLMRYHSVDITRFMVSDQNCYWIFTWTNKFFS
jgi:hypothetical protein